METFDMLDSAGTAHLLPIEPAADPLHLAGTMRTLHEGATAGSRSHSSSQAERSAMHPNRDDMEWHYCRSGQVG